MAGRTSTMRRLLLVAVCLHVGFLAARVGPKVWGKRLARIEAYDAQGPLHAQAGEANAEILARILASTPADALIVYAGSPRGAIEKAAALLWPRLLVAAEGAEAIAERRDRPLGAQKLVGYGERGEHLKLEAR